LVEYLLPKQAVAGSSPVPRSRQAAMRHVTLAGDTFPAFRFFGAINERGIAETLGLHLRFRWAGHYRGRGSSFPESG
jgi:hypothetical protein